MVNEKIRTNPIARRRCSSAGFVRDRRGVSSVEYALLLFAILLVGAGAYRLLGQHGRTAANKAEATLMGKDPSANPGNGGAGGGGGASAGGGGGGVCDGRGCSGGGAGGGGSSTTGSSVTGGSVASTGVVPSGWVCDGTGCRPGSGQCFVAGTLVSTPEGSRPIEQILPGDRVLSRDEDTGEFSARPIVRTFIRPATGLVDVRMARGGEDATEVRSTAGHPYWTLAAGWTRADSLAPGDVLLDSRGAEIRVIAVTPHEGEAFVYNLEVEGTHTYFAGAAGAWVHNVNPSLANLPPPNLPANPATWTPQQAESLASYLHDRYYGGSNQSHQGTTVAVGVYQMPNGTTQVVVNVSGDSWGGANLSDERLAQLEQAGRMPLGTQPGPAMRQYLQQNGWTFTRENFHAETGLATYANMNNAQGIVAGVSRPYCRTGICEGLMGRTFPPGMVGVRQNVPSSADIIAAANAAAGGGGGNAVAGPSNQGGGGGNAVAGPSNQGGGGSNCG